MGDGLSLVDRAVAQVLAGDAAPDQQVPYNVWTNAHANRIGVKSGPGYLYGFTVYNAAAAAQFILVFDAASSPAAGAVACAVFRVATLTNVGSQWMPPRAHREGIWLANSSTEPTLTAGAADCSFDVQYV